MKACNIYFQIFWNRWRKMTEESEEEPAHPDFASPDFTSPRFGC